MLVGMLMVRFKLLTMVNHKMVYTNYYTSIGIILQGANLYSRHISLISKRHLRQYLHCPAEFQMFQ